MTYGAWEIVGTDDRQLPLGKTLGDAVRDLVRRRWPHHTAKTLERYWTLDPKTARNVVGMGNVSERTLTKGAKAEGWAFWHALGEELFGESFYDYEKRRIDAVIQEAEGAKSNMVRLRAQAAELLASAPRMDEAGQGAPPIQGRPGESRSWSETDGRGASGTPRSRDRGGR